MLTDMPIFFNTDEFAQECTWGGASINIIFAPEGDPENGPKSQVWRAPAKVQISDVATPVYRTAVVISGTTWTVKRVVSSDLYAHIVELETNERPKL